VISIPKVSMYTGLDEGAAELEEFGWKICDGMRSNGEYPTFSDNGRTYECIRLTRPGKEEGVSASLIKYDDGLVLKVFSTSVSELPEGAYKFGEAIKIIKHNGNSRPALKDFVGRVGSHPFYNKKVSQALLDSMQFGGRADEKLLKNLKVLLKSRSSVTEALNWFDMDFKPDVLEKIFKDSRLKMYSGGEFLNMDIPETKFILFPIIELEGITLVTARTGIGKSHYALGCACAAACGDLFLRYQAEEPINVVYVDGEMSSRDIQNRLNMSIGRLPVDKRALARDNLQIIAASKQELSIPCLSTQEGQEAIEACITANNTLLILDNVSTLVRNGSENDDANWIPVQEWLVRLRTNGVSVLLIHHEGKGDGGQRGTTKRTDIVNTHIQLLRPKDYEDGQGARFEVRVVKGRNISGKDGFPFEAWLKDDIWIEREIDQSIYERVVLNLKNRMSLGEIAEDLDISKSYTSKLAQKALREGQISNITKEKPGRKSRAGK